MKDFNPRTTPDSGFLRDGDLAVLLNVSIASLRRWRKVGVGPVWHKVGGLVRYTPEAVNNWLNERRAK